MNKTKHIQQTLDSGNAVVEARRSEAEAVRSMHQAAASFRRANDDLATLIGNIGMILHRHRQNDNPIQYRRWFRQTELTSQQESFYLFCYRSALAQRN